MEKPGREKEVRGKKRDGQQRKEKGKDGNGKNERIYPLENILFDTNIFLSRVCNRTPGFFAPWEKIGVYRAVR